MHEFGILHEEVIFEWAGALTTGSLVELAVAPLVAWLEESSEESSEEDKDAGP